MANQNLREKLCLSWNEHQSTMMSTLKTLFEKDDGTKDVTLVSEDGEQIRSHRFILTSTSGFFSGLFSRHQHHRDPVVFLTNIRAAELRSVLEFMYLGQVFLHQDALDTFMFAADKLQVRGLADPEQPQPPDVARVDPKMAAGKTVQYDYQKPQATPSKMVTVRTDLKSTSGAGDSNSNKTSVFDPIDLMQQQSKILMDPIQEIVDQYNIKQEVFQQEEEDLFSLALDDLDIPTGPVLENNAVVGDRVTTSDDASGVLDPMSFQYLDWNRGIETECEVSCADTSSSAVVPVARMYSCEKCDYKSAKLFNVKKHTAAVHDGVRYPCKFCDYSATETGHLRKHMRTKHRGEM